MTATPRPVLGTLTLATALVLGAAACSSPATVATGPTTPAAVATTEAVEPAASPTPSVDPAAEALAAQQVALETLVAQAQPSIPVLHEQFPGLYSQIAITSEGADTLAYSYVYSEEAVGGATLADMQAAMSEQGPALQAGCDTEVFPAIAAVGVTITPKIRYTYSTPAGEEVFSYTCVTAA